jgi:hypothetical protein
MDIEIICNTDDAELFGNVSLNSRSCNKWITEQPAHDGHAIIVGGGPSLVEFLPMIEKRRELGQVIFALNGTAKFLNRHNIVPEYQVILDARPENIDLIGKAKEYLISSQCHPTLFESVGNVTTWHPAMEGIETHLPEYKNEYALIGGGTTVGLSTMCLAYTLGYRKMHLFGYDSSHRQTMGHAYSQSMNANDVLCKVTVNGKVFTSSLTMARQAELFPTVCNNLIDLGCIITVDGDGLIMEVVKSMRQNAAPMEEDEKYRQMWAIPAYRDTAPGELIADTFVNVAKITKETVIVDFGCGTGRGAKRIHDLSGAQMRLVDFSHNCLDKGVNFPLTIADLTKPIGVKGDIGYCTDVMEHIAPENVEAVIQNIMECVDSAFFQISLVPDNMGALIGQPLHLSVFPYNWWLNKFAEYNVLWADYNLQNAYFYLTKEH